MGSEREQRAIDALIVSQLRACDETDPNHLPELTDEEREALDSLGPDFVDRLLAGDIEPTEQEFVEGYERKVKEDEDVGEDAD